MYRRDLHLIMQTIGPIWKPGYRLLFVELSTYSCREPDFKCVMLTSKRRKYIISESKGRPGKEKHKALKILDAMFPFSGIVTPGAVTPGAVSRVLHNMVIELLLIT